MDLERIRERLLVSRSPVVLTGAGVSAESGVPTFRGNSGLWKNFRPEELATPRLSRPTPSLSGSGMTGGGANIEDKAEPRAPGAL